MILRCFLAKVFQAVQPPWDLLYFVQDNQRIARSNLDTGNRLQCHQYAVDMIVQLKELLHPRLVITVDVRHLFILPFTEVLHEPGLAHLSCTEQHQGLPILAFLPF